MARRMQSVLMMAAAALLAAVAACSDQVPPEQTVESAAGPTAGICARAPEVREALLEAIDGAEHCSDVSDEHLAAIEGTLDLSGLQLAAISADDLGGLDRLRRLDLSGNRIGRLPDHLFSRLPGLCEVDLEDNPGAPFVYSLQLLETFSSDVRHLAVEAEPTPPFEVNVLLRNEHVALSGAVVRISAGEQRSTTAQLGGVFGADEGRVGIADAAFAAAVECGPVLRHPGIELSFEEAELVVDAQGAQTTEAAPQQKAACAGIPTQEIVVRPDSFAGDEWISRLVTSRSGACFTAVTIGPEPSGGPGGPCTLTEYVEATRGGTSQMSDADGDCGWLRIERSAGQGGSTDLDGCAAATLRLRVDAETFNRRGRVDLVRYDPESRCYAFLSAAQDPDRDEPYRFAPDQACLVASGAPPSTDCGSILIWSGMGRGGVNSESEARAEVARIRPAVRGEAAAGQASLIAACLSLPPLSIPLDADAFAEQRTLHAYSADPDEQRFMALVVTPDPQALVKGESAAGRQCVVSTAFQLLGFPHLLPTTRSGDCGGLIHFAWYMPAGGQLSAAEFAGLVRDVAREAADSGTQGLLASQSELLCVNDVCILDWSRADGDAAP